MDKNTKNYVFLSTYIIVLYLALFNIKIVTGGLSYIMGILSPLVIGICIAFILNILLRFIENRLLGQLSTNIEWVDKHKRLIAVTLTYALTILMSITIILFIVPQVVESLKTLINTLPGYGKAQ